MRHLVLAATVAFVLAAAAPDSLAAQGAPERAAFVVRLGVDTVAVERFSRSATRLEGELVTRSPRTVLRRYAADLGPGGSVMRFEVSTHNPGAPADATPLQRAVATLVGDSIRVEVTGVSVQTSTVGAPAGMAMLLGGAYGPHELLTMRMRRDRGDSVSVPTYSVGARAASSVTLRRLGRDSVLLNAFRVRVDRNGRILGLHAPGTTQQIQLQRLPTVDVAALAAAWAARDAQGQAMGTLSPRDTVRASAAGANLLVDYGRPHKRGREIFGNVVPWGQVWRTGANAATQLRTDRELVFAGLSLPAGTYTLFTLPTQAGWQLIVNSQAGQWGTAYDSARDLGRVPLSVGTLAEPVEIFTIAVDAQGQGGVLTLTWDRTRATIPFTVR
jgi:hypothetical protein